MEQLVLDLESTIYGKFSGVTTAPQPCYEDEKVEGEPSKKSSVYLQKACLGRNICYIVSAVVAQEGRVLMMREAKSSCRGRWYLPAGRVERNESFEEAVIREVLEETGLHFKPTSIIYIDSQGTNWFRFTFSGAITSGKLKTLQEQDSESMEAGWFSPEEIFHSLSLRGQDIYPLIRGGLKWYESRMEKSICKLRPVGSPHSHVIVRVVVVKRSEEDGKKLFCILSNNFSGSNSFPYFPYKVTDISCSPNVTSVIDKLMTDISCKISYKLHGYLKIEHTGKPHGVADGLCLTLLVEVFVPLQGGINNQKYKLLEVEEIDLRDKIWDLIDVGGCVTLEEH